MAEMTILRTGWAGACEPADHGQAGYRKRTQKEEPDRQQRDGGGEKNVPGLGEVSPVRHDHRTEHHVVLGEVAAEELRGTDHGDAEDVGDLVAVGRVRPAGLHLALAVVVEGIEIGGRAVLGVQVSGGHGGGHPLVVREQGHQGFAARLGVLLVRPVRVHELDGLPQGVFALRVAVQVVHEVGHGEVEVVGRDAVFVVHDAVHELEPLALVDAEHDVVVEELALLHEDLRVVGDDVPVDDGPEGDVVGGRRDGLLDELPVVLVPKALHHVCGVQHVAAHLVCQDPSVLGRLVVDGPAGQGGPTLDNGLLEETCRGETVDTQIKTRETEGQPSTRQRWL